MNQRTVLYESEEVENFERQYREKGFASQRRYPNESLIAFLAPNYFHLSKEERSKVKVLELGCGSGANLWMMAKEGFDTYGVELTPTGLEYCEEMLKNWNVSATLKLGDMIDLPFQDEGFDVIFDIVSMQHLNFSQHRKCYREVFRCLKSGGRFFSYHMGENSVSLKSTTDLIDHCTVRNIAEGFPLADNGPTCFISANEVRRELNEIGYKDILIEKILRSYKNQTIYIEYLAITAEKRHQIL